MQSRSMNEGAAARYRLTDTDAHVSRVDITDLAEAEKKLRKLRENKDVATDLDLAEQLKADRTKSKKAKGDGEKDEKPKHTDKKYEDDEYWDKLIQTYNDYLDYVDDYLDDLAHYKRRHLGRNHYLNNVWC